jgi:hypothetical protein
MPRPHIEYIQSQVLPWQKDLFPSARPGAVVKLLSRDSDTGAASVLLRYPAGWLQAAVTLRADEEFYVIDGELDLGGTVFGRDTYGYHPAGMARGPASAPDGAVVITFFEFDPEAGTVPDQPDPALLIEKRDLFDDDWKKAGSPGFPPGGFRKDLREDPYTKDQTWVLSTVAFRQAAAAEIHPTIEEMYLLAGSVCGNCGIMRPGAYFWRPEKVPHGPYGTTTGTLYLFRTKGGALSTIYDKPSDQPYDWNPPYTPVLPADMEQYRNQNLDWIGNY